MTLIEAIEKSEVNSAMLYNGPNEFSSKIWFIITTSQFGRNVRQGHKVTLGIQGIHPYEIEDSVANSNCWLPVINPSASLYVNYIKFLEGRL